MGARRMQTKISLVELEEAFQISEEELNNDLSVFRISMIRDVHDESIELAVLVYGQDSSEEDAPIAEYWIDPYAVGSEEELDNGGIAPARLRVIFSQELWNLIVGKNIPIQWLCENGDLLTLNLSSDNNEIKLLPLEQ